jgi:putative MATE family efflux protein
MRIRRDVVDLTIPVLTEQIFLVLMGVINTMMAGNIGKEAVSAIGMVDSMHNIFVAFFSSAAVGATVVVAHYVGQEKTEEVNQAAKQALFSILGLALFITLLIFIFRYPIIGFLYGAAEPQVMKNLYIYLNITVFTYPFMAITAIISGMLRGIGDTKTPMKVTMLMNIVNVILSYVLIYGIRFSNNHFSFNIPGFGVTGAAIGISIARIFGAILMLLVLWKGSSMIHLTNIRSFRFKMDYLKSIFGVGLPASFESLMFNAGKLITQIFIVGMGTAATASNYVANSIASIIYVPGNAFSIIIVTMIGQSMGKRDTDEAGDTMSYIIKFSSLCLLAICTLVFPLAEFLVSLYSKEAVVIDLAVKIVRLQAIVVPPLWSAAFVLPSGLRGAGDVKYTMLTSITGMWLCRIVLGYVLGVTLGLGVQGVWIGMYIDWVIRGGLYLIRLKNGKWKQNKVIKSEQEAEAHS